MIHLHGCPVEAPPEPRAFLNIPLKSDILYTVPVDENPATVETGNFAMGSTGTELAELPGKKGFALATPATKVTSDPCTLQVHRTDTSALLKLLVIS
jgi:hypothetical protein